jgi:hypothetical protein
MGDPTALQTWESLFPAHHAPSLVLPADQGMPRRCERGNPSFPPITRLPWPSPPIRECRGDANVGIPLSRPSRAFPGPPRRSGNATAMRTWEFPFPAHHAPALALPYRSGNSPAMQTWEFLPAVAGPHQAILLDFIIILYNYINIFFVLRLRMNVKNVQKIGKNFEKKCRSTT